VGKLATVAALQGERPAGRMHRLGLQWQYHGAYTPLEEDLAKLQAVTPGDVSAMLEAARARPQTWVRLTPREDLG
jgi:predicted Zn-dependent peptidase